MTTPPPSSSQDHLNQALAEQARQQAEVFKAQAAQTAQQTTESKYAALVPDLTKVTPPTLDASNYKGGMATALAFDAMKNAAGRVREVLGPKLADGSRVLLTSQVDLVSAISPSLDVDAELDQLIQHADHLLNPAAAQPSGGRFLIAPIAMAAAAIPGVLSFFAKRETLTSSATSPNDLAATAAVAGALLGLSKSLSIKHDTFAVPLRGPLYEKAQELATKLAALEALTGGAETADVKQLKTTIQACLAAINSVPKGGSVTPLAAASFWAQVLRGTKPITHVLLVKGEAGATTELIDQRPVFSDRVFLAGTTSITFVLIDMDSDILAAGTESATVEMRGKIDDAMTRSVL